MDAVVSMSAPSESEIVAIVDRARLALDQGDVQAALLLSGGAYADAKAHADYATKVKASRSLIDKSRRLQADALKVETYAIIKLADLTDEAQQRGELAGKGRPKAKGENVQTDDIFLLSDIGVDRRELHEARKLRDAERKTPGIVEQAIEARISQGLNPTRNAVRHAIGTKTATKEERGEDLYETPAEAMRVLLALESFSGQVLEPSVGKGAILRPLEDAGYDVTISDLVDRGITTIHGECQGVGDFLTSVASDTGFDIVTNPPYGVANAYIAHALREHRPGKMAMLLNLNFLAGFEDPDRCFVMDECPPSRIYVFTRRLPMMHRDGWEGEKASSQMNTAWFVWERNAFTGTYGDGAPRILRVDWKTFEHADPLPAGAHGHVVSPLKFAEPEEDFTRSAPRKSEEQRVEEEFERAMLFIRNMQPFGIRKFCSNVAVRTLVGEALIDALLFNGLIEPSGDDEWVISPKGISLAIDVSAVAMTREWRAAREAKRMQGGGE